ncbi:membrane-bound dolichyl-phosphate-mannose-protein mannosyltransferase-like protein [Ignicoccus hospitalis]|uniref:Membrane-bound dolichyl-phosphate-mannose-protein mannosyltransferase-like protein n=1 Tax=Ignicoccus hospitalis (strain KIN4/I / DSM 18386 / JCM 14125) TaxID=453591 RepID=A8ABF7_IGNH4|nr:membrane-bound dolichyl-phosphate-mannose-protein mannosyltransferase-like protein [Ignicoccus hospitalis]ABU82259.1 membrane-bound dolichyl-phosphate-mannose-protein mannosyltransferase-like protein [Ignicoccus hospitalis KIN4/I]HIH90822.1 hypothetical protein [Desulfurococcaceae archaeon]
MNADRLKLAAVLALSFLFSLNFYNFGIEFISKPPFKYNYISDEVWYVSASRNLMREVFRAYPNSSNATVQAKDIVALTKFISLYSSQYGIDYSEPYSKIENAAYLVGNSTEGIKKLMKDAEKFNLTLVQPGWKYPDHEGILKYLNLEHPPLAKYIIGLKLLGEDLPPSWRLPGVALGSVAFFALPVALYLYSRSLILSLGSLLLLHFDEAFRVMSMVAMLDGYAASFSVLSLAALPLSPALATLFYALASNSKYTALFYFIPIAYVYRYERGKSPLGSLLRPLGSFAVGLVVLSLPIILGLGFDQWLSRLVGGVKWFLTSRPSGPPPASPLDWLTGNQPSPLYVDPALYVYTNPSILQLGLISFFALFPLRRKRTYKPAWLASLYLVSALLGLSAVYLAGNKTLYTFYVAVFTPMADVAAAGLAALLADWDSAYEVVEWWAKRLKGLVAWSLGRARLECKLEGS